MPKNLTPRAIAALAVVAVSFFLMVCVARYGAAEFANARAGAASNPAIAMSNWLVTTLGTGVWVMLVLPMAWGVIVYFEEKTPDLLMRFVGTIVLAVSASTLAGLLGGGLWAGHVGNAVAGSLGGLSASLGGFGTVLAWLLTLSLFGVSLVFATDWMFHSLRRAGRTDTATAEYSASEPVIAELLEDPALAEPREFVRETPRAAVAAAEMEDIVEASSAEARTPSGWEEMEESGRTVISAPSGYRGVEFLQPSDELAIPEPVAPRVLREEPGEAPNAALAESAFHDDILVTTPDAAFFVEAPDAVAEADTQEMDFAVALAMAEEEDEDVVDEAVQTLFAAVTKPEPVAAPTSGIGLPADSPFHDEFFAADAGWPFASEPVAAASDGASAAAEMAGSYSVPAPEPVPAPTVEPAPEPEVQQPALVDEQFSMDEVLVSRLPESAFDDSLPAYDSYAQSAYEPTAPAAEPEVSYAPAGTAELPAEMVEAVGVAVAQAPVAQSGISFPEPVAAEATPVAEPAPQLNLFAQSFASALGTSAASVAPAAVAGPIDLTRIHTLELDPMFHDAVGAILERGRASAVVLQRQLGIGYARGIRILDQMTATGLVGPDTPTGAREIRVTREAWQAFTAA